VSTTDSTRAARNIARNRQLVWKLLEYADNAVTDGERFLEHGDTENAANRLLDAAGMYKTAATSLDPSIDR
jgi:hypothetical protein